MTESLDVQVYVFQELLGERVDLAITWHTGLHISEAFKDGDKLILSEMTYFAGAARWR